MQLIVLLTPVRMAPIYTGVVDMLLVFAFVVDNNYSFDTYVGLLSVQKIYLSSPLHIYRKIRCDRFTIFTQKIPKNFTKKIRVRSHNLENAPFFCVICERLYHSIKSVDCIRLAKICICSASGKSLVSSQSLISVALIKL
jgi:hypothetical protein